MTLTANALERWEGIYPEISKEHTGLAGNIINRGEAQTLRLALVYALLDGQERIDEPHLNAALAMWGYAQDSALYIFGDRAADPLELRVLALLDQGPLSATDLSRAFSGHMPKERLQPILQQLEAQRRISSPSRKTAAGPNSFWLCMELVTKAQ